MADANGAGGAWRGIDELARLVGAYCWVEHRIFELTGAWASAPGEAGPQEPGAELEAERRVWCAAVSGHHAALAGCWAERLPVRAGVDRTTLVAAPEGPLAGAFEALEAEAEADLGAGVGVLVRTLLPRLHATYLEHLRVAAAVREAPVMEVLAGAQRLVAREIRGGRPLAEGLGATPERGTPFGTLFEQTFEQSSIFPAVRPS